MLAVVCDSSTYLWNASRWELLRILRGHTRNIKCAAFGPANDVIATGGSDARVNLWDIHTGALREAFHESYGVTALVLDPTGRFLAVGDDAGNTSVYDLASTRKVRCETEHLDAIQAMVFAPSGHILSVDTTGVANFSSSTSGALLSGFALGSPALSLAFEPSGNLLAAACFDRTVKLWDCPASRLFRTLEGHTTAVTTVAYSARHDAFVSSGSDGSVRLWHQSSGKCLAVLEGPEFTKSQRLVELHGSGAKAASVSTGSTAPAVVNVWQIDHSQIATGPPTDDVAYTSAKIVVVGESGVGKTGLGWRLAHDEFKEHPSTHGQQFWVLKQFGTTRADGTQCEAILWDLAGQPDYRLIHALFVDDADLALVVFDPTHADDPFRGVDYWLKQLRIGSSPNGMKCILVAARCDRGPVPLTRADIDEYCGSRGVTCVSTSAFSGDGIEELTRRMHGLIAWDEKSATVTTRTFKKIKEYVLALKENTLPTKIIRTVPELTALVTAGDPTWSVTTSEMLTVVSHLAHHGYVTRIETASGEPRVLMAPESLNNLAASMILAARGNPDGLGSLDEEQLLAGGYVLPELVPLSHEDGEALLSATIRAFLQHDVCFRETDPLGGKSYLVFPGLINLRKPKAKDESIEEAMAYTVSGQVENVYASLVVLLGYTRTFARTNRWHNYASYESADGSICGFRLEAERDGELDFVLFFGVAVPESTRLVFQGLFESFLSGRRLAVQRFQPARCENGHTLNRATVRELVSEGAVSAYCTKCRAEISLLAGGKGAAPPDQGAKIDHQRKDARIRSLFERSVFSIKQYAAKEAIAPPECFISYASGNLHHESWVEHRLATDLLNAGVRVLFDRWDNAQVGSSISRFVERITASDFVLVVGTPAYLAKYVNKQSKHGSVVAAEVDLLSLRLMGSEAAKATVLPLLVEGDMQASLPPLLQTRVIADFRNPDRYFATFLSIVTTVYGIELPSAIEAEWAQLFGSAGLQPGAADSKTATRQPL